MVSVNDAQINFTIVKSNFVCLVFPNFCYIFCPIYLEMFPNYVSSKTVETI